MLSIFGKIKSKVDQFFFERFTSRGQAERSFRRMCHAVDSLRKAKKTLIEDRSRLAQRGVAQKSLQEIDAMVSVIDERLRFMDTQRRNLSMHLALLAGAE